MLKYKNTVIAFILSVVCMLPFCGCHKSDDQNILYKTPKYTISKDDGGYYINLLEDIKQQEETGMVLGTMQFTSLEEMKQKLKSGDFSDGEMQVINRFPKDEQNRVKLCNVDRLYEPVTPSEMKYTRVSLKGERYGFGFEKYNMKFLCLTSGMYERTMERYAKQFDIYDDMIQKKVSDRNANEYYYSTPVGRFKNVEYTYSDGKKTLLIEEEYNLEIYNPETTDLPVSSTVPDCITIYGTQGDLHFEVFMIGFESRPSLEWLSAFELKAYEGNNHEVQ